MLIEHVRIRDYRNIAREEMEPSCGINLIFGANAQGKTNFLDALHLAAYLKSARAAREREIVRAGAARARVEIDIARADGLRNTLAVTAASGKKFIRLDGNPITRFEDAIGVLSSHFFFPGDLSLVKGDPALRRETLDYEVVKAHPAAVRVYADFRRALQQRNAILKKGDAGERSGSEMKSWTERMIATGVEIARMRAALLGKIQPRFAHHYGTISPSEDRVEVAYLSTIADSFASRSREELRSWYAAKLEENVDKELDLCYTTTGPHRDELLFTLAGESLRRFGSQGQQRSAVLAFKIALCDVARELSGEDPVLCLDDALSELDDDRKKRLIETLEGRTQTFITLASEKELKLVSGIAKAIFVMKGGKLKRMGK